MIQDDPRDRAAAAMRLVPHAGVQETEGTLALHLEAWLGWPREKPWRSMPWLNIYIILYIYIIEYT